MPDFVAPQLCASVEDPPTGDGWCHEIKFDGYRIQMRVEDGDAALKTRKGLDWTDKFPAIAKAAARCPTRSSTARSSRSITRARRISPRCRRRFPTARPTISSSSPSICCLPMAKTFAGCRSASARARLKQLLEARKGKAEPIRYVEHFETRRRSGAASACNSCRWKASSRRSSDAPYRSGRSESWTKAKCRAGHEVVIGGWKTTNGKFRSLMAGVHRGDHLAFVGTRRHRLWRRTRFAASCRR